MTQNDSLSLAAAQADLQAPYVSIIIPVYNTQAQLTECLMSAVFQTLPEIEVIAVNDASTDNSQQVIDWFVELFPGKMRSVVHECNQGPAAARHTGVLNARAPYVIFLDSDDFINGKLCEVLLEENRQRECDILFYGMDWYDIAKNTRKTVWPQRDCNSDAVIRKGLASFSSAMFRREFLLEHQDIAFQKMRYEDAAVMPILVSRAKEIGACRATLYFYNLGVEDSFTASGMTVSKKDDLFCADLIPWKNIPEALRPALTERIIRRAVNNTRKFPEIYDQSVFHMQELLRLTEGYEDSYPPEDRKLLEELRALPGEVRIPKRVYVNGFLRDNGVKEFDRYMQEAQQAYLFGPQVVVLDESTCQLSDLPQWLQGRSAEEKGLYFAVRRISEQGGIYISPAVDVMKSFNREAFSGAFFVAGPQNLVLPIVFGAEPGSPVLQAMRAALEKEPAKENVSVAEIMAHVLIGECGVHLNGKEERGLHGVHVLHFKHVCRGMQQRHSYCELNYSNFSRNLDDVIVLPRDLYDMAWDVAANELDWSNTKAAAQKKELIAAKEELRKVKNELKKTEKKLKDTKKELQKIKKTRAWKLVTRMRGLKKRVMRFFGLKGKD